MAKIDVYKAVTDRILKALEEGTVPWRKPWTVRNGDNLHKNFISKRPYRGVNPFLLELTAQAEGYTSPYWLSFKQAKEKGGKVRKGEKGTLVVFWKRIKVNETDDDGEKREKTIPLLRHYYVFNIEQTDGIEVPQTEPVEEFDPIERAESILKAMPNPPKVRYGGARACYVPALDEIRLPNRTSFRSSEGYYATDFHEHVHSTGHADRLARKAAFDGSFGDATYAKEELTAEMGSAMLMAVAGLGNDEQSAAYIRSWISAADYKKAIHNDRKLVVNAAAKAQQAADYIQGLGDS